MSSNHTKRVLVVDDDRGIRELLVSALASETLVVDTASDGNEALDLIGLHRYTVVVLDLLMPVLNGFQVLEAMRGDAQPVVLVLTGADRSVVEQLDSRLVHGIIRKPFDPQEIATVIRACAEIRDRKLLDTMALATMLAGGPFLALLSASKM
jgi:DNA-binding response OmpR family regulator